MTPALGRFRKQVGTASDRVIKQLISRLSGDIKARAPKRRGVLAASFRTRLGRGFGQVGTDLVRARFTEFGTVRSRAQPFVSDALGRVAPTYERRLFDALKRLPR